MTENRNSKPSPNKSRLDVRLVELNLAPSREKAQALILSGQVLVNDTPCTKAGQSIPNDAVVRVRAQKDHYVARSAHKLKAALDAFQPRVNGRRALDVGASTGGFTQVLLEAGIDHVVALDVGHNQLDWRIRQDSRVTVLEKKNARYLEPGQIQGPIDLITIDVSFISISKILPALIAVSHLETDWITLIKPQFELGPERVGKGGIVRNEQDRQEAVAQVTQAAESLGLRRRGLIESPITGTDGNQEYLAHWKRSNIETN